MEPRPRKAPGRTAQYGEPAPARTVYVPVSLWQRLSREADIRNLRVSAPAQKWNTSQVVVDMAYTALGITNPARKEG